jgi:hypothetical protein
LTRGGHAVGSVPAKGFAPVGSTTAGRAPGDPVPPATTFRFGDGLLDLASDDAAFRSRFHDLYLDCIAPDPEPGRPRVRCTVRTRGDGTVAVQFDDPEPLDAQAVDSLAHGPRGDATAAQPDAWREVRAAIATGAVVVRDRTLVAAPGSPWQSLVASLALHRVLRLQRDVLFFHAAAVGIRGNGLLLVGPKAAGKTTLSLALADARHQFLADEIAAVRTGTMTLLPFWRRLSVRRGPAAPSVTRAVERGGLPVSTLPDGSTRIHLHVSVLHPGMALTPVPLRSIVFLGGRAGEPALRRFRPGLADLRALAPFESVTWGTDPGGVALRVLALMNRVRCYTLDVGPIPATVSLLATLPE